MWPQSNGLRGVKRGQRAARLTATISCAFQELGLPSHGDKQQMMKRHAEYVTIFNANCDASRPRPGSELMKAMDAWERTYELDITAREEAKQAQRRVQDQEQWRRKKEMAQK